MADESDGKKLKLRLKKTDTNRMKTETSRQQRVVADAAAAVPEAVAAAETGVLEDPMTLRDTKTGKLRRIQSADEEANALAPGSGAAQGRVNETVRLKVVRDGKKPEEKKEPLTSSQTIHLRPSGLAAAAAAGTAAEADEPKVSDETLRVMPPGTEEKPGSPAPDLAEARSKQSTSTLQVVSQAGTVDAEEGFEESETKTAVPIMPTAAAKRATSTLRVSPNRIGAASSTRPTAVAAGKKAETAPATLRVSPPTDALAAAASAEDETSTAVPPADMQGPASKYATTMLKIRPGTGLKAAASAPRPAAAAAGGGDAAASARPSLRLRRQGAEVTQKVEEPAAVDQETRLAPTPAETVPVATLPEAAEAADRTLAMTEDETATQSESATGLRVKQAAKAKGAPRVVKDREEAAAAAAAKPAASGPGLVFSIACAASLAALGVTTALLVKGFLAYCR